MIGRTFGSYRVLEKLGAGGMGEVYKAHDTRLDRAVALKVLPPEFATPERMQRFEQEARAASTLNHPNILTIHDVGRDADVAWFAMEWVDGRTLRDLLGAGRLPIRQAVQIASQIADGLAKAHAAGIVHRDLKPENVMLTSDGFVKIVDFGIAKLAHAAVPSSDASTRTMGTSPGLVIGTVGYMSPEQASGRPVDYRSDQFALGLLVYEMVTGVRPFERSTAAQSIAAIIEADPAPLPSLNPAVPPHLASIVSRCLAKDPGERYESTRDLARDLKGVTDTNVQAAGSTPAKRRPAALYAGIAAMAVALAAGVFWLANRTPLAPSTPPLPLLVVRPFTNLSADASQTYFAAGITEEIRGRLSQIASLRLLSRNALEGQADSRRAARDLGVTQFVDGSVRVDGGKVRVTAELIDASTQQTLWSNQYDRDLADVLAVQTDVALQVANALRASLSPSEQQRLGARVTGSAEAYDMYLQARTLPSFDRAKDLAAIDLLRRALALDPRFAAARASLAFRLVTMGYYAEASNVDEGIAEAEAAIRTSPDLPAGHYTIATGYSIKGKDAQARVAFLRALELDPNNGSAMANLSVMEATFGRLGESLSWARRMFALSGRLANDFYHVAVPLLSLRDDAVAGRWLLEGERRFPDFSRVQATTAMLEVLEGRDADAAARMARAIARHPDDEELKFYRVDMAFLLRSDDLQPALEALGPGADANSVMVPESIRTRRAYLASTKGDAAQTAALLAQSERVAKDKVAHGDNSPTLRVELAAIAAMRGDHAGALEWLNRAYDAGYRDYGVIARDPILARIEPAATFKEIMDRMRLDVDTQRQRARQSGLLDLDSLLAQPSQANR
jgi:TolB-like protein/Tfp pilus assembly protein PilF/predicted Ser/Thr protein kinase